MFNFLQIVITILKNIFTFYFLFISSINTRMNIVCYSYVFKERNRNSRMRVKVERSKNEKQHMIITFDGKSIRGSRASSDEMAGIAKLSSALVSISHPSLLFSFPALLCEFSSLGKPSRSLDSEETLSTIFHARSNDTSGSWKHPSENATVCWYFVESISLPIHWNCSNSWWIWHVLFIHLFILFNGSLFFFR